MKSSRAKIILILFAIMSALMTGLPGCGDTATNEPTVSATAGESERDADRAATATATTTTPKAAPPASAPAFVPGIQISFRQDPRITSTYQGDNWVSPAVFTLISQGNTATVEARAQVIDDQGRLVDQLPDWTATDPGMISVSPPQGNQVSITIRTAGQSSMRVSSAGFIRELQVKASIDGGSMRVGISQAE